MSIEILRKTAFVAAAFVGRHPYRAFMPIHEQLAAIYVHRVSGTARLVELACAAGFQFEGLGLVRPLFEMFIKLAYVLQRPGEGASPPVDVPVAEREQRAWHVYNHELSADNAMFKKLAAEMPGHFDPAFLEGLGRAGERADVKGATGGIRTLRDFAQGAGVLAEYNGYHGTLSLPAHGTVNAARFSVAESTEAQATATLKLCARFSLLLLDVAAQLLGDETAVQQCRPLLALVHQK